ncbi:proline--tRNA ligase [Bacteroidia bacterium]|nr:proline--tRNA ligase [Bacteroidia bacterium]
MTARLIYAKIQIHITEKEERGKNMPIKVETTKPSSKDREKKEMVVYDLLEKLQMSYQRVDHAPAATIADCQDVDRILGIHLCKNLFLCNAQKTKFYLLVLPGEKKFKTKDLSKQINSSRLSFADAAYMEQYLGLTPGAVTILGLMNDTEHAVSLLIDQEVLQEEYLGCHPCVNTASLKLSMQDILTKFLPYTKHTYTVVDL